MKQIVILLSLFAISFIHAQENDTITATTDTTVNSLVAGRSSLSDLYTPKSVQIVPPSPQSSIFERFVDHPVEEYYGLPEITIPLYEIEIKGLKVPIAVSYHAGGVKYLQFDGDVGAGWSINAGGYKITRTVYGKSDFDHRSSALRYSFESFKAAQMQSAQSNFYADRYLGRIYCETNDDEGLGGIINNSGGAARLDGEYDQFTYMTPSTNGHFILTPTGVDIVEQHPDLISISKEAATLTDASGFQYLFGGQDTPTGPKLVEVSHYSDSKNTKSQETAWSLRQIVSPYNETVKFRYVIYTNRSDRTYDRYKSLTVTDASVYTPFASILELKQTFDAHVEKNKNTLNPASNFEEICYISEIETDKEIITFNRTSTNYKPGSSITDINTPCLLSDIQIKNKQTNIIKKISFTYKTTPVNAPTNSNATPWHVLLTSVNIGNGVNVEKKYNLEYYEPSGNTIPYPDQWGYYKYNAGAGGTLHLLQEFGSDYIVSQPFQSGGNSSQNLNLLRNYYTPPGDYLSDRSADATGMRNFSLRKITYPTGGYTEYEYEPNKVGTIQTGGHRVKTIRSYPGNGDISRISRYVYGINESGSGYSDVSIDHSCFYNLSYVVNVLRDSPGTGYNEIHVSAVKNYSEMPVGDVSWQMYKVFYPQVTVYNYNEGETQHNGKIVSEYQLNNPYETEEIASPNANLQQEYTTIPSWTNYHVRKYAPGFSPKIVRRKIFTKANQLLQDEVYAYTNNNSPIRSYEGLKVFRKMYVNNHETQVDQVFDLSTNPKYAYNYITSFFDYMYYTIPISGKELLTSKSTSVYQNGSDPVTATESYTYNNKQQIASVSYSNSSQGKLVKQYQYPQNYTDAVSQLMVTKNMLNLVVEQIATQNNTEVGRIKTSYTNSSGITTGLILPSSEQTSVKGNQRSDVTYDKYDIKGNLLQYTRLDGVRVTCLWGYNYQYLIAELINATYNDIPTSAWSIASKAEPTGNDWTLLENLRNSLPSAHVTIYKYKPLVGVSSVISPNGRTTNYEYDAFNCLQTVSFMDGSTKRVIESYNYNYRPN